MIKRVYMWARLRSLSMRSFWDIRSFPARKHRRDTVYTPCPLDGTLITGFNRPFVDLGSRDLFSSPREFQNRNSYGLLTRQIQYLSAHLLQCLSHIAHKFCARNTTVDKKDKIPIFKEDGKILFENVRICLTSSFVTRVTRRSPHDKSDAKHPNYINQQCIKQITEY